MGHPLGLRVEMALTCTELEAGRLSAGSAGPSNWDRLLGPTGFAPDVLDLFT